MDFDVTMVYLWCPMTIPGDVMGRLDPTSAAAAVAPIDDRPISNGVRWL